MENAALGQVEFQDVDKENALSESVGIRTQVQTQIKRAVTLRIHESILTTLHTFFCQSNSRTYLSRIRGQQIMPNSTDLVPAGDRPTSSSCFKCKKDAAEFESDFTSCERCDTQYCTRSCLVRDWKAHKKSCARTRVDRPSGAAQPGSSSSSSSSSSDRYALGSIPQSKSQEGQPQDCETLGT